jgi:hypothetical protein
LRPFCRFSTLRGFGGFDAFFAGSPVLDCVASSSFWDRESVMITPVCMENLLAAEASEHTA